MWRAAACGPTLTLAEEYEWQVCSGCGRTPIAFQRSLLLTRQSFVDLRGCLAHC